MEDFHFREKLTRTEFREEFCRAFAAAVAAHRHWDRPPLRR